MGVGSIYRTSSPPPAAVEVGQAVAIRGRATVVPGSSEEVAYLQVTEMVVADPEPEPEPDRYAILTAARRELTAMARERYAAHGHGDGIVYQACLAAEDAVFDALNAAAHHGGDERALAAIYEHREQG